MSCVVHSFWHYSFVMNVWFLVITILTAQGPREITLAETAFRREQVCVAVGRRVAADPPPGAQIISFRCARGHEV